MSKSSPPLTFEYKSVSGQARHGVMKTRHGEVETPAFMPVGTHGAVKGLTVEQLRSTGADVMLVNAFHAEIRPGSERIERLGGLHAFTGWDAVILTDSGGYQVFSLSKLLEIDDEGVTFRSPLDGAVKRFTPGGVMKIQARLGADIAMQLDECTPYPAPEERVAQAVERSIAWARAGWECWEKERRPHQVMFPIVQGGIFPKLRERSARALVELDASGYAIGGLSVGEGITGMLETIGITTQFLPLDKPRYLMGAGRPEEIVEAVARGVDLFDCVMPARNARNGHAFTFSGVVRIRNARYAEDSRPLEEGCPCIACRNYSRAALRHFMLEKIMTGEVLLTIHNLTFYQRLMERIREAVSAGNYEAWATETVDELRGKSLTGKD